MNEVGRSSLYEFLYILRKFCIIENEILSDEWYAIRDTTDKYLKDNKCE